MNKIYGINILWFFFPILTVTDVGIEHKGKQYKWEEIIVLKRDDNRLSVLGGNPSATLLLSDATIIRISTRIKKKGSHEPLKFSLFSHKNEAYIELVSLLESARKKISSPLENEVVGLNYIFLYRLLLVVSLGLILPLLISPWVHNINMSREVILILGLYSFITLLLGGGLFVRKIKSERHIKKQLLTKGKDSDP